jgi:hypothetical protein
MFFLSAVYTFVTGRSPFRAEKRKANAFMWLSGSQRKQTTDRHSLVLRNFFSELPSLLFVF